jgi:hypothetical protein
MRTTSVTSVSHNWDRMLCLFRAVCDQQTVVQTNRQEQEQRICIAMGRPPRMAPLQQTLHDVADGVVFLVLPESPGKGLHCCYANWSTLGLRHVTRHARCRAAECPPVNALCENRIVLQIGDVIFERSITHRATRSSFLPRLRRSLQDGYRAKRMVAPKVQPAREPEGCGGILTGAQRYATISDA